MHPGSVTEPASQDPRVLRSRAALMGAAVRLVSERGSTALSVKDLAEAAGVSRQLVYLQFGDRDTLLVEAAADLVRRELFEGMEDDDPRAWASAMARHFAGRRAFYRAMLTGSCAFAMTRTLTGLFGGVNDTFLRRRFGVVDEDVAHDLAAFVAGGTGAVVNDWLIDGDDPLDPEALARRLLRLTAVVTGTPAPADEGETR
ncbi:TetR/AcrR family transcriptional regulator [Streptomyces sp. NPDC005648]|uniref:TetR/AcrR family transcriptional regulator n=1 Tax=Streptomyces sp. NPDC005648 TaxID=3157044 RepID=UPI0033BEE0EF